MKTIYNTQGQTSDKAPFSTTSHNEGNSADATSKQKGERVVYVTKKNTKPKSTIINQSDRFRVPLQPSKNTRKEVKSHRIPKYKDIITPVVERKEEGNTMVHKYNKLTTRHSRNTRKENGIKKHQITKKKQRKVYITPPPAATVA